jgi:hypothetical protein
MQMARNSRYDVFKAEFEKQLVGSKTMQDAYEASEEKFESLVGHRYYAGWDSFNRQRKKKKSKRP